jgi:hypothetical protein
MARVLRQTGSVVGVALFGSLIAGEQGFIAGAHLALLIATALLLAGGAVLVLADSRSWRRLVSSRASLRMVRGGADR